jgi:hypothetical protein
MFVVDSGVGKGLDLAHFRAHIKINQEDAMTHIPHMLFRGEDAENADLPRDGRTIFFTDNPAEALEYGPYLVEARIEVRRMFEPGVLELRRNGAWRPELKDYTDTHLSRGLFDMLVGHFGERRAEAIYYHVEGGSWSEVEKPEVQAWLRSEGFDGFICWEGAACPMGSLIQST